MKRALVCGAGGFIGGHLIKRLKKEGYWVRGTDIKQHEFAESAADEFLLLDLRGRENCEKAIVLPSGKFDEVYQLAADMGGMGFIHSAECEIVYNNVLINVHMTDVAAKSGISRYFFSSSACVYRDMQPFEPPLTEYDAYPAMPDNEYGWEKLYSERLIYTYSRHYDIQVRIARFQNTFGPEGTWRNGREKAPAAMCRKVAEARNGGVIEIWGDGTALRSFNYVDDIIDGIYRLMQSDVKIPVNIGRPEYVSVNELVEIIARIAEKKIRIRHIQGPVGVKARAFTNDLIRSIGWEPRFTLEEGLRLTYPWIKKQVEAIKASSAKQKTRSKL